MTSLFALILAGPALAQDCDAAQLTADISDASPVAVPRVFLKLVECDQAAALKAAELAMSKTLHGPEGNDALLASLRIGAEKPAQDWVNGLDADHRSQTIMWLGEQCDDVAAVGDFFVNSSTGPTAEAFLKERWYRGMSHCELPPVQALLRDMVETPDPKVSKQQQFGFLEVYARNLSADAIPHLKSLISSYTDVKDVQLVLNAFSDAANVGSIDGIDLEAAQAAIQAIKSIAATLPPDAIPQARDTLVALGDNAGSDALAKYRWPSALQPDGYHYGVYAQEIVTCKNGKQQGFLHYGVFVEPGMAWPDALEMDVDAAAAKAWKLTAAADCKGEGKIKIAMTTKPLADDAALDDWLKPTKEAFVEQTKGFQKADMLHEDAADF